MNWLVVALLALTVASWASTFLLVRAAWQKPRIGALTERAVISVILSTFGTVSVFLVLNSDTGASFLAADLARNIFRLCLFAFLLVPVLWLGLYLRNGLG